jgi:hypothetical protein
MRTSQGLMPQSMLRISPAVAIEQTNSPLARVGQTTAPETPT